MFGLKKKKKNDDKPINPKDLSYLDKKQLNIHNQFKDKLKEHLMGGESVIAETHFGNGSVFLTQKRLITINSVIPLTRFDKKVKRVSVDSIYYSNIASVTFQNGVAGMNNIVLHLQGNLKKAPLILLDRPSKAIYNILNEKVSLANKA